MVLRLTDPKWVNRVGSRLLAVCPFLPPTATEIGDLRARRPLGRYRSLRSKVA
jgi:hypothetical protein